MCPGTSSLPKHRSQSSDGTPWTTSQRHSTPSRTRSGLVGQGINEPLQVVSAISGAQSAYASAYSGPPPGAARDTVKSTTQPLSEVSNNLHKRPLARQSGASGPIPSRLPYRSVQTNSSPQNAGFGILDVQQKLLLALLLSLQECILHSASTAVPSPWGFSQWRLLLLSTTCCAFSLTGMHGSPHLAILAVKLSSTLLCWYGP
ncbi:unnamed protein product [Protopolystoma xenopodis]|uniref:Uncharacterized protein n=1 Tax=Protopolystoma xenopodis TaxID=117903 RepID=A0A3S5FH86_9PLAT|nr:unnamed protein product [Protopolystoma xenopodis]